MARYIDADRAVELICNGDGTPTQKLFAECCVLSTPIADVAPTSEVAREIFEEICEYAEQQIEALSIAEKVDTSGADFFGGGKQAFVLLLDRIAELKKKYTGEQI